ncbi:hypothetical protein HHX47_DHR2000648 [Lentinula edodes]|nr:hypothetical protein HHX47_DHR2000648 [Lentinula edodes]
MSDHDIEKRSDDGRKEGVLSREGSEKEEINLTTFHEKRAGRLVVSPQEARIEFGEAVASKLKLSKDGTKVLWPQPTDSPYDPQNWSNRRKHLHLFIITLAAIVPDFDSGIAMRCLTAVFATAPQVTGLYVVTDLFPFHLQARKLNIWTMGFIISPFLSPFAFGFLVARTTWRWAYGIGCIYGAIVCVLIILFMQETMYDRTISPIPEPAAQGGFRYRFESLVGISGYKMAKYRVSWQDAILSPFKAMVFGFSIGINTTNAVFLGSPPPLGYGFSQFAIAGGYGTPIVAVLIGELIGRFNNDFIMNVSIRRNSGVFEAESRLWACYLAMPLYICGFVLLGASFQDHLSVGALVMGWGISELAVMINTVATLTVTIASPNTRFLGLKQPS